MLQLKSLVGGCDQGNVERVISKESKHQVSKDFLKFASDAINTVLTRQNALASDQRVYCLAMTYHTQINLKRIS